jgi:arginase family enzyme
MTTEDRMGAHVTDGKPLSVPILLRQLQLAQQEARRLQADLQEVADRADRAEKSAKDAWQFARALMARPGRS